MKKVRTATTEPEFQKIQIPKLESQPKVCHGQYAPFTLDYQVILPPYPPPHVQLDTYRKLRDQVAQIMVRELKRPGDDVDWSPEALAALIEKRLTPPGSPSNFYCAEGLIRSTSVYQTYLESISKRQNILNSLTALKEKWQDIQTYIILDTMQFIPPLSKAETEAMQEVISVLRNLDHDEFRGKFDQEFQGFITGIESRARFKGDDKPEPAPAGWEPRKSKIERLKKERERRIEREKKWELAHTDMRKYFPSAVYDQSTKTYFNRFTRARAAQTTNEPAEITHVPNSPASTVEDIIRTLPKDLDLVEEIYRFTMISGLENILRAIRPQVRDFVKTVVEDQLANIFPTLGEIKNVLESVLKSTQEEDIAWRESLFNRFSPDGMSPEAVYKKLQQVPDFQAQIRTDIFNNPAGSATSLSREDLDALKQVPSTRRSFMAALSPMEKQTPEVIENEKQIWKKNLIKIENFKEPTSGQSLVNHPFIEEFLEKGIIDLTTRTKLQAGRLSKEELVKGLGSEAEFKKLMMDKHAEYLLQHCIAPESQQMEVVYRATKMLTESFLVELDRKAKSIYLTRDAFLKPNSFKEVEAWMVYDQQAIREFIESPASSQKIIKCFAESYLPELPKKRYKSVIDQLLTEMKLPLPLPEDEPKENILAKEFPNFDERLYELLCHPLVEGSNQSTGISFKTLSQEVQDKLKNIVQEFYTQRETLKYQVLEIQRLKDGINQAEENELALEIPQLSRILASILWPGIELD
ncbi:hypothetical protein PTTG_28459 [Puccinia triticina 1-1 BBBD Race 1]|uniref:Uncharacterized protein n=2 Tax=Puccinia triticina TaxID=208348 RepID=A0A180GBJ7_PUCT1|nr:uncharacterized protein PtA15_15A278 [Puccinia triticina]OAV90057.1 hypothetical protein PTTG_28459 [Puccinia triticina 1-1 BBBD Race 1]WAQ91886.1 hypothetical protein PtA15_15A278 [Puccinia triticina]WAR62685.1 hypothetical protein PtB15_15B272 [Puccinia triticina]